jgi:hypothetical protein
MNPNHKANTRLVFLRDIPEAVTLSNFIKDLDAKYSVDSTDPDNTFGRINLERPIVRYGVSNTLYLAGISTYRPADIILPKHKAIPHADSVITISQLGEVALLTNKNRLGAKIEPITIEESDIKKLQELRLAFKEAILRNAPLKPDFSSLDNDPKTDNLTRLELTTLYDDILLEQGFAPRRDYHFKETIMVPNLKGTPQPFVIEYTRLSTNRCPHFSTTYDGSQRQEYMHGYHPASAFYKKWDNFHLHELTLEEYQELLEDIKELKESK